LQWSDVIALALPAAEPHWRTMAKACCRHLDSLNVKERAFVQSMAARRAVRQTARMAQAHLRGPAMTMLDAEIIERARAIDMLVVTERHGLQLAKRGREYLGPCPRCGGCSRFSVNPSKAVFLCRGCDAGGAGAIDLKIFVSGCSFPQAIEALTGERMPSAEEARAAAAKRHAQEKATQAGQIETARWLWEQRQAPQGSIVERYLAGRGYTGMIPATLAYLPPRQSYPPAAIAAYALQIELDGELRARADEVRAVHITRLLADGSDRRRDKDDKGSEVDNKISIGAPLGYPIAIAPVTDSLSLVITEGIEDALAYRAAGFGAWAAGAAGYSEHLAAQIPPVLETLILERHPDAASYAAVAKLRDVVSKRSFPPEVIIREAVS
jgi:hypothetical protein